MPHIHNVIIIGSGPAGHSAAIYTARAMLSPLMFEGWMAGGVAAGGQLTTTTEVENYPGFADGIDGTALMMQMRQQSINSGCEIKTETVDKVKFSDNPLETPHEVYVGDTTYFTKTVIIATGATARRLGLPGEDTYRQNGISACAVCDGGLPIFRGKHLIVIGGGDSACEEANYLTKFASKVTMLVRKDHFKASKVMGARTMANDKIEVLRNTEGVEILGDGPGSLMTGIKIKNNQTGEETQIEAGGLFYAIGHTPNTVFLDGQLKLDNANYIEVEVGTTKCLKGYGLPNHGLNKELMGPGTQSSEKPKVLPGVYAGGDVQDRIYRQAITSAGTGCMAALDAEHFLAGHI